MKKQEQVNSGNFAIGADKKGNFNAYGSETGRFFIHKQLMESLGWKKQEDVKFPFFAIIEEKELDKVDVSGTVIPLEAGEKKAVRVQASAIFAREEDMLKAFTSSARFAAKANALVEGEVLDAKIALKAKATAAGLTDAQINALATSSVL